MRLRIRMRRAGPLFIGALCLLAVLATPLVDPVWFGKGRQTVARGRGTTLAEQDRDRARPVLPANLPVPPPRRTPEIFLSSAEPPARGPETGLARFILALQANQWERAAGCLATTVPARERNQLRHGRWLHPPRDPRDPAWVFYMPRIRLRAESVTDTQATVQLMPDRNNPPGVPAGVMRVTMVREGSVWRVHLRLLDTES
ncbi:MAG: hypothetical protein HY320_10675 [Armatimonadetes bacterium]|nr:hypothetical protein [Armatimonadota bacterium]